MAFSKTHLLPIPLVEAVFHATESEGRHARDIAAIPLSASDVSDIPPRWQFLTLASVRQQTEAGDRFYLAFGYPEKWFRLEDWSTPSPLVFVGGPTTPVASNIYDPRIHLAISFDRKALRLPTDDDDLAPERLPMLHGISGCGIWRVIAKLESLESWQPDQIRLVAIEHRCKHDEYMVGTWMGHVVKRVSDEYSDVNSASAVWYP